MVENQNVLCIDCSSDHVIRKGYTESGKRRFKCKSCGKAFSEKDLEKLESFETKAEVIGERKVPIPYNYNNINNVFETKHIDNVKGNVIVFGCVHTPYQHPKALDFICKVRDEYKCDTVINAGDFVDSMQIHPVRGKNPDAFGPLQEIEAVRKEVNKWAKAIPDQIITWGNHDLNIYRAVFQYGLPKEVIKDFNDIFEMPKSWEFVDRCIIDNKVLVYHGVGKTGANHATALMNSNHMSVVAAHIHSNLSVTYNASPYVRMFAVNVGSLINCKNSAFLYNKGFTVRPLLGCAVLLNQGNGNFYPIVIPMEV